MMPGRSFFTLFTCAVVAVFAAGCDVIEDSTDDDGSPDPGSDRELSGSISTDLTLTAEGAYRVVGDLTVHDGATLTIEPGAILEFEADTDLTVSGDGRLSAIGTEEEPILLTGTAETPGWWDGVVFTDARHPDNVLDRVTIEYGGGNAHHGSTEPANLTVGRSLYDASVTVTRSTFRHSGGFGLFVHSNGAMPGSGANTYHDNESGPAAVHASSLHNLDSASTYGGEGEDDPVRVQGDGVDSDATWQAIGVPYRMAGATQVSARLTIEAGAAFHFDGEGALRFGSDSVVRALGTAEEPILFTGTQAQPGWWHGIYVTQTLHPENLMEHVIIEYAGRSAFHGSMEPANLAVGRSLYDASLTLRDSVLRDGAGVGLFVHANGRLPDSEANTYTGNGEGPVALSANNAEFLDGASTFSGNGADYVWMAGNDLEHDATWQALDVPYGVTGTAQVKGAELTIDPGAVLAFDAEAGLTFGTDSIVSVVGTAEAPILFTGTQQQPGWWRGVAVSQTTHPSNEMRHVTIEYGGGSSFHGSVDPSNLTVGRSLYDAALTLTDSTLRHSADAGVYVHGNGDVNGDICTANTFSDNAGEDCTVE
ncbi:MAG: hypothetical protein ACQEXJ_05475 [Myxococcota bacterium]